MGRWARLVVPGIAALAVSLAVSGASLAQQAAPAGIVTAVQGKSVAVRAGLAQPVQLKFKDEVFLKDRVETGDESLARILLGGKALVTVRERSVLTITEVPGKATVDLVHGRAAVSLGKSLLRAGESIEIRTPNAIAAVRGSTVLVQFEGDSGDNFFATLHVSKPVEILLLSGAITTLGSDQIVSVTTVNGLAGFGPIGPVPAGLAQWTQIPLREGSTPPVPDQVIEKWQSKASEASEDQSAPFGLAPTSAHGVFNNPCGYASCAGPPGPPSGPVTTPTGSPPPFAGSTQPVVVVPAGLPAGGGFPPPGGGPPGGGPPGGGPPGGGPSPPPPSTAGPSFTQPAFSGIKPNTPGHPTSNFLPNQGGVPPGLQNKGGVPPGRNK